MSLTHEPATELATESARERAERRVKALTGLGAHWIVFVVVNTALALGAVAAGSSGPRLAGWGLGLALHTAAVLVDLPALRERLVERELARAARTGR